jgi:hypothetical protein
LDKWGRACRKLAHKLGGERYWLQLLVAALRDEQPHEESIADQSWDRIARLFESVMSPAALEDLERVVLDGFDMQVDQERKFLRGRLHKSAKDRSRELYGILWQDAERGQCLIFPPKSLDLVRTAEGYPKE